MVNGRGEVVAGGDRRRDGVLVLRSRVGCVACAEIQSAQQTELHQHRPRNRTRRKREQAGRDGGKTQGHSCAERGTVQTTTMCEYASENDNSPTDSQCNTCTCTALRLAVVAGVRPEWWWEERLEMETGGRRWDFFLPAPLAAVWRLFAACAWRAAGGSQTERNRGQDRN
jgi:hypothetical protein